MSSRPRWRRIAYRLNLREVLGTNALVLLALWGIAVAQPVFDLFGKNPEFFVANELSSQEIVVFAITCAFLPPVVLIVVECVVYAINPSAGAIVDAVLVAVLGAMLGLTVVAQLDLSSTTVVLGLAAASGLAVVHLERHVPAVKLGLRYLCVAPFVFLAAFLFFSSTSKLLTAHEATAAAGVSIGNPAPLVVLQMDEFPLASLLLPDGTINAERFPNFARLAQASDWFRNATLVSPKTTDSVPAMLTGLFADPGSLPTSSEHPRNLFTLLGGTYDEHVTEPVTSLCPTSICQPDATQNLVDFDRIRGSLLDSSVVYAQATLPAHLRDRLPAVDQSWGGFITEAHVTARSENPSSRASSDPFIKFRALGPAGWAPRYQSDLIGQMTSEMVVSDQPTLWFTHATFPHMPWLLSPEGYQYVESDARLMPGLEGTGIWGDDSFLVRQAFQRHLLQVGYMDRLLGELMDRMKAEGIWDDAMVVVLSDHGVAFTQGLRARSPADATVHEIYNIPLFVKRPGQTVGGPRDDNALSIDVLPTIVDALDIRTSWTFDGQTLLGDGPRRLDKPVVRRPGHPTHVPVDFDGVLDVVRRNEALLPNGNDWRGVFAVGRYGSLVGSARDDLDIAGNSGWTWTVDQANLLADWRPGATGRVPMLLNGHIDLGDATSPEEALVIVNGRVAGIAGDFGVGRGATFSALINDRSLRHGHNDVELLVPRSVGSDRFATTTPG